MRVCGVSVPAFKWKKLRHREGESLAQAHTASERKSVDSCPV